MVGSFLVRKELVRLVVLVEIVKLVRPAVKDVLGFLRRVAVQGEAVLLKLSVPPVRRMWSIPSCGMNIETAESVELTLSAVSIYSNGSQFEFVHGNVNKIYWVILQEHGHIDRKISQLSIHLYIIIRENIGFLDSVFPGGHHVV